MKTNTNLISRLLLSCFLLFIFNFSAQAQYPTPAAPVNGVANAINCGNMQTLDNYIWAKVNGNIVSSPNAQTFADFTGKTLPGASLEINFNINKFPNRFSLVSYTIDANGNETIYDYQSNLFNAANPSQGNSNQQKILIPTCKYEVYFVKGCIQADPDNYAASDIIDMDMGGFGECNSCPVIANSNNCFDSHVLEVIDRPATQEKELLISVINTSGAHAAPSTCGGELIGDVFFTNIQNSQTKNNQPYAFRFNYQESSNQPTYYNGSTAFVFDQRNNHNYYEFDLYQSEVYRFRISDTEYNRLTSGPTPAPQICVELDAKHPEPGQTPGQIYCENIDFTDCEEDEPCFEAISTSGNFVAAIPEFDVIGDAGTIPITITNTSASSFVSASITTSTAASPITAPANGNYNADYMYTVSGSGTQTITFTGTNTTEFRNGDSDVLTITVNNWQDFINNSGAILTLTINGETIQLETGDCGIITPLPVELTAFTGKAVSEGIALNWKTASEKNNDRFEIERSSDGRNFEKIGDVKGNGTSNLAHSYSFLDKYAQAGVNYYRLNQVDFGGTNERSHIIKVSAEKAGTGLGVQLIPNPCQDQNCTVQLKNIDTSAPITVELRDLTGRLIFSQQVPADQNSFQLPRVDSGNGIYILSARNGSYTAYQKIVIQ